MLCVCGVCALFVLVSGRVVSVNAQTKNICIQIELLSYQINSYLWNNIYVIYFLRFYQNYLIKIPIMYGIITISQY